MSTSGLTGLERRDRTIVIATIVWLALQLPRFVALVLIGSVAEGTDAPAWMYPAILDVVCAAAAPFVIWALWKRRGLAAWTLTVAFLVVSIVDHVGFFVTSAQIGSPIAFESMGPSGPSELVPGIQTVVDVVILWFVARRREGFFTVA